MANDFITKIQEEAKKGTGADIVASKVNLSKEPVKETEVEIQSVEPVEKTEEGKPIAKHFVSNKMSDGNHKVVHTFKKDVEKKMNNIDQAMEATANAFVAAMSEANISTLNASVFGPLVAYSALVPTGFKRYNAAFLDDAWFVLEKSNRIGQVHKMIADAYHDTDSNTIAFPYIQRTRLTMNVYGSKQKIEADYLLFSEEEIKKIELPYVKEVRIETDGNRLFLVIEVTR